ncbi:hypothetical protein [Lactococcus lactis]|uniref:hypothetical protein n=1 Tax=Lactococcus lactis TaxID=1358 RepID=UPI00191388B0|nr:hypothetical protein [Lactococcus lactis]WDA70156.1 hypothetical protein IL310_15385 [Lactococcus lactis]WDA70163.1 hypothetical protein IL310_15350 [Lactococcus lactis]
MGKTQIKHALKTLNVDDPLNKINNAREVLEMLVMSDLQEGDPKNIAKYYGAIHSMISDSLEVAEKICENNVHVHMALSKLLDEMFDEVENDK